MEVNVLGFLLLSRGSMTIPSLTKETIELGLASRYRGLVHYHPRGRQGATQADMVPKKELRVLHHDK